MHTILQESKLTLSLALPIITGQLSQMLMGVIDTLMIGRVGTDELAAVAFVNVLFNFPLSSVNLDFLPWASQEPASQPCWHAC